MTFIERIRLFIRSRRGVTAIEYGHSCCRRGDRNRRARLFRRPACNGDQRSLQRHR